MKIFKRILIGILIVLGILVYLNYPKLNMISGYASKYMASSLFIANHSENYIVKTDLDFPLIRLAKTKIDTVNKVVTATVFGLKERKSVYREGLGVVLTTDDYDPNAKVLIPNRNTIKNDSLPFPYGTNGEKDTIFENVNYSKIDAAIAGAFAKPELQKTRTVLVVYKNQIIGERYIDGFTKETPVLGWSMTKSIMATLYGILQHQGKINVNDPAPIPEWQNDERKNITINNLLRMQSGLKWEEDYTRISDVTKMLFLNSDMSIGPKNNKTLAPPVDIWNYSSGTSNLLTGILKDQFKSKQEFMDFPYTALIDKIGMHSMLLEADVAGTYVGSSYSWATTRDWSKLGLLYLHQGNWNGEQLFSPDWCTYVATPTPHSDNRYGAHFWLNAKNHYPDVPNDIYSANGFQGQYVFVIPSKDLVIVRTGLGEEPDFDVNAFLSHVIEAIGEN